MSRGLNLRLTLRRRRQAADLRRKDRFRLRTANTSVNHREIGLRPMPRRTPVSSSPCLQGNPWRTDRLYRSTCKRIRADNVRKSAAHAASLDLVPLQEVRCVSGAPYREILAGIAHSIERMSASGRGLSPDKIAALTRGLLGRSEPSTSPARHSPDHSVESSRSSSPSDQASAYPVADAEQPIAARTPPHRLSESDI